MLAPLSSHQGDKVACSGGPGHGIENGRADPAEDRGVGGNAKCQSQDRDGGESGILHQHSMGISNILKQNFHKPPSGPGPKRGLPGHRCAKYGEFYFNDRDLTWPK